MFRNKKSEILWGLNHKAYMYGSKIVKRQDGSVQFYNPLVPSGTEIQSWMAIQNYQAARTQPALPLLKKAKIEDAENQLVAARAKKMAIEAEKLKIGRASCRERV